MTKSILFLLKILMMMSIISLLINYSFINKKIHPMSLGSMLTILTMILSLNMSMFFHTHWFSFILFLIIVSGLMIMFMYFTSFINNMKIFFNFNLITKLIFILLMNFILMKFFNKIFKFDLWIFNNNEIKNMLFIFNKNLNLNFNQINYMYMFNKNLSTIFNLIYLFICLTLIVKLCLKKKYSIRKIN